MIRLAVVLQLVLIAAGASVLSLLVVPRLLDRAGSGPATEIEEPGHESLPPRDRREESRPVGAQPQAPVAEAPAVTHAPAKLIQIPPVTELDVEAEKSAPAADLRGDVAVAVGEIVYRSKCVPKDHPGHSSIHVTVDVRSTGWEGTFSNGRGVTILQGAPLSPSALACVTNAVAAASGTVRAKRAAYGDFQGTSGVTINYRCQL